MARSITLTSGSIFNGNPITFAVTPSIALGGDSSLSLATSPTSGSAPAPTSDSAPALSSPISMHRIILEVECGMSGGNYEVIKLSSPVIAELGNDITIDISSALRTFRDSYEYTPDPTTYPLVKFNVKAYDEYMVDGEVYQVGEVFFPQNPLDLPEERRDEAYLRTVFGAFSDMERVLSGLSKGVSTLTRKPSSIPQLAVLGESFAYTPPYTTEQKLEQSSALTPPQSKVVTIPKEGLQTLGYQSLYALPSSVAKDRQTFRFINSFGVLESINVQRASQKKRPFTLNEYVKSTQETFNSFSHGIVKKQPTPQSWRYFTDPLDELWLEWYLEEFLMAENVWMLVRGKWLRVHIIPEDEYTFLDEEKNNVLSLAFSVRFDINGSIML